MSVLSYLDAATGSMVASLVVAGGAGIALFFKRGWWQFTALFSKSRREQLEAMKASVGDDDESEEPSESLSAETVPTDL